MFSTTSMQCCQLGGITCTPDYKMHDCMPNAAGKTEKMRERNERKREKSLQQQLAREAAQTQTQNNMPAAAPAASLGNHVASPAAPPAPPQPQAEAAPAAAAPATSEDRAAAAEPMDEDKPSVDIAHVSTLTGHDSEVFICAWSSSEDLLASG